MSYVQYITCDPNVIKVSNQVIAWRADSHVLCQTILATEFDNYVKGEYYPAVSLQRFSGTRVPGETFSEFMNPVLGTGVFNSDGKLRST